MEPDNRRLNGKCCTRRRTRGIPVLPQLWGLGLLDDGQILSVRPLKGQDKANRESSKGDHSRASGGLCEAKRQEAGEAVR